MESYVFNKSDAGGYALIKEGEYEVVVAKVEEKTLESGKQKIAIQFKIREDVDQEFKGRILFEDIWKEKDNPLFYNRKRLNQLLGTQHIENGKTFSSINDLLEFLKGAMLIAKVGVEYSEYKKEDVNKIAYYKSTKNAPKSAVKTEVKDEDLPF